MYYRTKTYIAGDWTGDNDLIQTIMTWNESNHWSLSFADVHKVMQARDSSLPCSIKRSLAERLDMSKTFVLIVGEKTNDLKKGSCQYCSNYCTYYNNKCKSEMHIDYRSFIQYECEKAVRDRLRIVVIYNYCNVNKLKCPECLRYVGTHIPAKFKGLDGKPHLDYDGIKRAISS